jgi:DNA-binding MarR family transcriptional regulator
VWLRLLAVHKRGLLAIRENLEREMTLARFDLLADLAREDGQTIAALSRSLLVTPGNLTGLIDRAARDEMVERRADPTDRRAWRIHLTVKGQRAFHDAERRHSERVTRLFAPLSAAEMELLMRLLGKVKAKLRAGDPPAVRPSRSLRAVKATTARRRARLKK